MCRVYGDTVRLCFRTGRRGVRVPVATATWNASHRHVIGNRATGPRSPRRACALCGTPAVSKHSRLCGACERKS